MDLQIVSFPGYPLYVQGIHEIEQFSPKIPEIHQIAQPLGELLTMMGGPGEPMARPFFGSICGMDFLLPYLLFTSLP